MNAEQVEAKLRYARHRKLLISININNLVKEMAVCDKAICELMHQLNDCGIEREGHMKIRIIPGLCERGCLLGWVHGWRDACTGKLTGMTIFGLGVMWR